MAEGDVNIGMRLPRELVAELDDAAELLGLNRSEVIRRGLAVYTWQTRLVRDDLRTGKGGAWRRIFGPPVAVTSDASDETLTAAFRSIGAKGKPSKGGPALA